MSKTVLAMLASLLALAGMVFALSRTDSHRLQPSIQQGISATTSSPVEITVFCAASNQAVMEEIRRDYEKETGRKVVIQYGASQTLLSQIEVTGSGDIFLPADDSFLTIAREKKLVEEVLPVATMQCGVVVLKGNPKSIHQLSDLFRSLVIRSESDFCRV